LKNSKTTLSHLVSSEEKRLTVLLIDNDGFSDYTCYLAKGLSKYLDVILYGFSEESFNVTGASKVTFPWHMREGIFHSSIYYLDYIGDYAKMYHF
jgi:hypothetical protein